MRLIRARMMLAGGLMAVAAATSGVVLAGPASAGSSQVVLVNCNGAGQVRPAGYDIGCMPSNELVTGLTWIFTAQRPGHAPAAQTFVLPASGHP